MSCPTSVQPLVQPLAMTEAMTEEQPWYTAILWFELPSALSERCQGSAKKLQHLVHVCTKH